MAEYVSARRLQYFLNKLKTLFVRTVNGKTPDSGGNIAMSIPYGELDSTSTATVMTATVPGITELSDGIVMYLKNGVITSASGFTININNLGAKPVYSSQAAASRSTTIFNVNYTAMFIYNEDRVSGGCWDYFYGYDSNTNTIGYQLRTNSTTLPVTGATYRYRLLFTSADGTKFVPANTSTSTNATAARTVNQDLINPFGRIVYYSTTAAISQGGSPAAAYLWDQYNITLGYSFNRTGAALELTPNVPVYIKCAPQRSGYASARIDADNPYVQALPSTADDKIYIFLGIATGATTVEVAVNHPVYYYADGSIREWTNAPKTVWYADYSNSTISAGSTLATTTGDFYLAPGNSIVVRSTNANGISVGFGTPTLAVDGLGAVGIKTLTGEGFNYLFSSNDRIIADYNASVKFTYDGTYFIADRYNYATSTKYGLTIKDNGFGYMVIDPQNDLDPNNDTVMVRITSAVDQDAITLVEYGMHIPYFDVKCFTYTDEGDGAFSYDPFSAFTYWMAEPSEYVYAETGDLDLVIQFTTVPSNKVIVCVHGNFVGFDPSYA